MYLVFAICSFIYLLYLGGKVSYTKANFLSGLRLILIGIGILSWSYISTYEFLALMSLTVLLDLADGFIARKYNEETDVGQHFDMEVDAFYVMSMCLYYFLIDKLPWWILMPGLFRYSYGLVLVLFPKNNFVERKQRLASIIAGIFFIVLLACIVVKGQVQFYILLGGSILLGLSFLKSTVEYIKY